MWHDEKDLISGFIHPDSCTDCNLIYIGQIKLSLKSRLTEHKLHINYKKLDLTAFCEHSMTMNHIIDKKNTVNVKVKIDCDKRLFAESWFIKSKSNGINKNEGNFSIGLYPSLFCERRGYAVYKDKINK